MTRTDIINKFIISRNYLKYLEIGVRNPDSNFNKIRCAFKVGVDPNVDTTYRMTSDEFFKQNTDVFDIIFIDGLHLEEQVDKDISNSLKCLSSTGVVILHDCNPISYDHQIEEYDYKSTWNGTVWKSFAKLRMKENNLSMYCINTDHGCGVIEHGIQQIFDKQIPLTYQSLEMNRKDMLNLINVDEFLAKF